MALAREPKVRNASTIESVGDMKPKKKLYSDLGVLVAAASPS